MSDTRIESGGIHPVRLKNVFRRIRPNSVNLFYGRSPV